MRFIASPRGVLGCAITIIFATGLLAGSRAWTPEASQEKEPSFNLEARRNLAAEAIKLESACKGLTILGIEDLQSETLTFRVIIRNDYDKPVAAYWLTEGKVGTGFESLASSEEPQALMPGQIRKELCVLQEGIETYGIKLHAVRFTDGTTDGAPQVAYELQQFRMGNQLQRQHLIKQLDDILASEQAVTAAAIQRLQATMSPLTQEQEMALYFRMQWGMRDQRRQFLEQLAGLEEKAQEKLALGAAATEQEWRQGLLTIKERYSRYVTDF